MTGALPFAGLRRLLEAAPPELPDHACEQCGAALQQAHRHVANVATRSLSCVCDACHAQLRTADADAHDSRRTVPQRYVKLPATFLRAEEWRACDIPVGIVFLFHNSSLGRIVTCYPGSAGATESLLDAHAWDDVIRANAGTRTLVPDVEALLVRRTREADECFIVPIDACYELTGRIRSSWSGFSGGPQVHSEIDMFFDALRARSEALSS